MLWFIYGVFLSFMEYWSCGHCMKNPGRKKNSCKDRKGHDVWPSMVTHTRNLCSAFNSSKCTHTTVRNEQTHTHTHTVNTHPEQWAANAAALGEQLGVRCLDQGSHLSRDIESGESAGHSLPPPTIPAGLETWTRNLWVTSPTLNLLGHDCPWIWNGNDDKNLTLGGVSL